MKKPKGNPALLELRVRDAKRKIALYEAKIKEVRQKARKTLRRYQELGYNRRKDHLEARYYGRTPMPASPRRCSTRQSRGKYTDNDRLMQFDFTYFSSLMGKLMELT